MSDRRAIPVAYRTRVMTGDVRRLAAREGLSLAEIVQICPDLPPQFAAYGMVCVNGEAVPRAMWARVRPKVRAGRDVIVTLHVRLRDSAGGGGGSGGKSPLTTVAAIAVVAAAAFVSGGGLVPLLGASFASGTVGAAVAGAAVGLAGSLAIAALSPPPTAARQDTGSTLESPEARNQGAASISGNVLQPGAPVPRCAGSVRVFPPLACQPLVETVGDDEYAEAIFLLAGPHQLQDIRIGKIPISEMDEVNFEISEGLPGSPVPSLVSRQSKTDTVNLEISHHELGAGETVNLANQGVPQDALPEWHRLVTRESPDEFWIRIAWPRGLFDQNDSSAVGVPMRLRMRKQGETDWINLPEIHFYRRHLAGFSRTVVIKWDAAPEVPDDPPTGGGFYAAYIETQPQTVAPATTAWTADAVFDADAGGDHYLVQANAGSSDVQSIVLYEDRAELFWDPSDNGIWEIEIKLGVAYDSSRFTPSTYVLDGAVYDFFTYYTDGSTHRVRLNLDDIVFEATLPGVSNIWNEHPVAAAGDFAMIAMKVHNRQLGQVSVLASGYLPVYDTGDEDWETTATSANPADWFRHVLTGDLGADPVPLDLADDAEIIAWRANCVSAGYEVNAVIEGRSQFDALSMIAACGFARPRQSEKWGVMYDRDRSGDAPVQVFSPRNLSAFRWEKAFADRPDALRVSFRNAAKDYERDERTVLDPAQSTGGVRLEAVSYDGLVTAAEVDARALFDMAQGASRMTFYHGQADWEAIVCTRGDLVAVQHDTIARYAGFSRVKSVSDDGGSPALLTGVTLDGSVVNELDNYYLDEDDASRYYADEDDASRFYQDPELGVAIQCTDGTFFVKKVTGDEEDETGLTFETPFDDGGLVVAGAHVVSGPLGREYSRMILLDIAARDALQANLTFVDEAPELFA